MFTAIHCGRICIHLNPFQFRKVLLPWTLVHETSHTRGPNTNTNANNRAVNLTTVTMRNNGYDSEVSNNRGEARLVPKPAIAMGTHGDRKKVKVTSFIERKEERQGRHLAAEKDKTEEEESNRTKSRRVTVSYSRRQIVGISSSDGGNSNNHNGSSTMQRTASLEAVNGDVSKTFPIVISKEEEKSQIEKVS